MSDLREAVTIAKKNPDAPEGEGPICGRAPLVQLREAVKDTLRRCMDMPHKA